MAYKKRNINKASAIRYEIEILKGKKKHASLKNKKTIEDKITVLSKELIEISFPVSKR